MLPLTTLVSFIKQGALRVSALFYLFSTNWVFAATDEQVASPQVGSKVASNVDVLSMLLSLFLVLGVILVAAFLLKKFNLVQQHTSAIKVIANYSISNKEKLLVVEVAGKQLLLGVTAQQINVLTTLDEPLESVQSPNIIKLPDSLLARLKK